MYETGLESQIEQDREVENVEENQKTISPAPKKAGGGRRKTAGAAPPQGRGGRKREEIDGVRVRVRGRGERELGLGRVEPDQVRHYWASHLAGPDWI
jgi:hypothetical protein